MSEPNEEEVNLFTEIMTEVLESLDTLDDEQTDQQLSEAIQRLFNDTMQALEVPEDDEELANRIMSGAITTLMRRCFLAGMLYQFAYTEPEAPEPSQGFPIGVQVPPVRISPEMGAAIVLGLMNGDGISLRLVLDRGQN